MAIVSCKKKEDIPVIPPPQPMENPAPLPPAPEPIPEGEQDGTSIKVGSNGLDINTKNGDNNTKVIIKNDGAAVEIKK
jgi:hypothetical protein